MASSADDWRSKSVNRSSSKVDHRALAHFVPPWIFDQLSWHNQLQYLMINRSWWQIIFWARLLPSPFLRHSFVFSFIRFNSADTKPPKQIFRHDSLQSSPISKHFAPSKSPLLKIGYCTITNLEQQRWSKLMHIFLPGVIPIPPKCKTRKRGGDKSSSHLHHFLSSSISSLSWGYLKTPFAT